MCSCVCSNPDEKWEKAKLVYSHIKQITSSTQAKDNWNFADLYFKISKYEKYVNQNFNEALLNAKICLDMRKKLFENDHDSIAIGLNNISVIYLNLGDYKEALK
jgi:hypothetical protein